MLKSMTGFGRARSVSLDGTKDITAEIKSVNNRYLDVSVRLPRAYSFLEEKVKTYLSERGIVRGKIEVFIGLDVQKQDGVTIALDEAYAASYLEALYALRDRFSLPDDISVMRVAANRDLFLIKKQDDDMEKDWADVQAVLSSAIDTFLVAREKEGENLRRDILQKAEKIRSLAAEVKVLSETDIEGYQAKLDARIRKLLEHYSIEIDEQRILTEVAIYADRAAIDEELVRLDSHFSALHEILDGTEPAGRRLDFLLQEMNRETNTIGSKAGNTAIARIVVDMKSELEKIREQIQNIE